MTGRDRTRSHRRVPFFLVAFLLIGALVTGIVSMQALVSQSSFRLAELADRTKRLEIHRGDLALELAELRSPDRIEEAARRLGLRLPSRVEILPVEGLADEGRGP